MAEELSSLSIPEYLAWVWIVFEDLSKTRPVGMGLSRIPWAEFEAYVNVREKLGHLSLEDVRTLFRLIPEMDNAWMETSRAKQKSTPGKP